MQQNWQQGGQYGGYGGQQQQPGGSGGGLGGAGFMGSQPTGFGMMGPQPTGFGGMGMGMSGMGGMGGMGQQPTGFQQQQQQQPQPTGFQPQHQQQQQRSNISPLPTGQQQQQPGGYSFLNSQPTGFRPSFTGSSGGMNPQMTGFPGGGASGLLSQPTGFGGGAGGGMMSQPTGMGGGLMSQPTGMGGLRAQPTGVHDPRLQTMMNSFMPSNASQPFNPSGAPQFNQSAAQPLQQQFQSLLQNPSVKTPKVPWVLTKQEKKDYDQIFRAWDTDGDGFITGETSREVFGQSGLDQDSLMKIWTLSDVDNRGKLNLPEFHVAMGLIYRALNGNEIPDRLPEELIPASMRDIDTTVSFMRDLLKHEANTRSNTSSPLYGSSTTVGGGGSKDATAYKHDDTRPSGYKPSSRHLDRKSVRYAGEDSGADIGDIRRQLANTSAMLDKSNDDYMRKTEEDEQLEQDVDDLKYRVKRIQDDIEYLTKGRRSADKDEERRKLEREMLFLMHEKLPELERRQKQREEDKRMEERAGVRARDRRNDTHGRYRDGDRGRDRDEDRDWLRGSYDRDRDRYRRDSRDRDRSRDRYDNDRSRDRSRERYDRPRSPPRSRTPPPAPPPAPVASSVAPPPPAPPAPTSNATAAPSTKNMTAEERSAFIREQAQRRIQERLKALGVESGSSTPAEQPAVDKSVEERLEREKREAEEKSQSAEKEQAAREEARRQRLQGGGAKSVEEEKPAAGSPSSTPLKSAMKKAPAAPPAPPTSRGKVPPPAPKPRHQVPAPPSPAPPAPAPAAAEEEDPEEAELRRKEESRAKAREDRKARMAALEAEEEEERKQEEARLAARQAKSTPATSPAPSAPIAPAQSPPAPAAGGGDHNPFRKPGHPTAASGGGAGGFNPFFKPQAQTAKSPSPAATPSSESAVTSPAAAPPPPPPPAPPAPPAAAPAPARAPPALSADDEWERIEEKTEDSDDDSSDDDYAHSRTKRAGLASALFGNITGGPARSGSSTPTAPPAPKAPPPAALANLGGGTPSGGGMSALLSSIQGGARLKKAQTVDKSGPGVSGRVIGGADVPDHINATEPPAANGQAPLAEAEPEAAGEEEDEVPDRNPNRQSVDWLGGLAADHSRGSGPGSDYMPLETTREEADERGGSSAPAPAINVLPAETEASHELDEFDLTKTIRVRTLFPYDGQRDVDLSFIENVVIEAHPAKDPQSPWWYGTLVKEGKKGWFPHTYVDELKPVQAKASFTYDGQSEDELPFVEGDVLTIIDTSDSDWWKTERAGVIFIVPASYFELLGPDLGLTAQSAPSGAEGAVLSLDSPPVPLTTDSPTRPLHKDLPPLTTSSFPGDGLLSPRSQAPPTARPRSSTVNSATSATGSGYDSSSSEDSMLSFWSDDDEGASDVEDVAAAPPARQGARDETAGSGSGSGSVMATGPAGAPSAAGAATGAGQEKEAERKRREEERQRVLEQAGLKIRREPPGVPGLRKKNTRRRPAPAPGKGKGKRRPAPGVPPASAAADDDSAAGKDEEGGETKLDTLDAYARYESYLAQAQARQRSGSVPAAASSAISPVAHAGSMTRTMTPQHSGPSSVTTRQNRSSSVTSPQSALMGGGRFSGLISRIMAPSSSGETPPRKSISIVRVDDAQAQNQAQAQAQNGEGSGTATPAMDSVGRTWTSLVESSVLETMSDKERKRQEAIFEFIATEGSYNRDLQIIVEAFYATMLDMLDEKALAVIFANIEDILLTATAFLSSLEQRQKACRLYVDVIGDILEEHIPRMRVYMAYCVNQQQAIKLLQSQRESNPALSAHLQTIRETNPAVRGLDLSSFLLIPMQRITRYPLLLRQILQYTSSDQDLSAVQTALNEAENITAAINESVRDAEGDERLRVLSEDLWIGGEGRLDLTAPTAYQGPRKLLKEGAVTKAKSGRKLTMILCNDIVVLVESRNLYRMPIPLHEVQAREGRDEAFQLKVEFHRGGDTVGLKASSTREAKEWVSMINKHRAMTLEARNEVDRMRHHGFSF